MNIHVKESTIIRPAQETPKHSLWISDLDLLVPAIHLPAVGFYRLSNDNSSNFFDVGLLKESMSKVLVPFYPMAGRLGRDENGRIQIQCNGEGVLFQEAEANCIIDDFGDFSENLKLLRLVPTVDDTNDISSYPFLVAQITRFECGGVSLGVGFNHIVVDGTSMSQFVHAWAEMTRGVPITNPPFLDRTVLSVGVPTSPTFNHIEYNPPPSMIMNTPAQNPESISTAILELSIDQINILRERCKGFHGSNVKYTRYEILAAHIWRCICRARGLSNDQINTLYIPTNGRSRLNPPLHPGFFGNVVFITTSSALSGDIQSEPLIDTVERIHTTMKRMDDEYLKSALAYLKQLPDPTILRRGAYTYKCPNLNISHLIHTGMCNADFGWGRAMLMRTIAVSDGVIQIIPNSSNDGSFSVLVNLETRHLQLFKKLFYGIFEHFKNARL
ncbi:Hydroxycinnamoyl-CoA shikimate/quinate hydroxycinnamoyl transferase [Melia azedarach]|uniref:Hydroxycinnamoyl-CoA shikimate/quinate hydroxycinnamoyl transferase n=1 Tax=Melia azedarach TaxID=155640 RepID=A0ACC1XDV7_MELAZ|nr:Hydroxycinnamoyl-CoA shikimate/quinate hydroxycinnamoyl transferase [Melia azedarach]